MFRQTVAVLMLLAAAGCSSMAPGKLADVQTLSDRPRAGNVYLLRGFIGIFSTGIDHLGEEINTDGVRAKVYQDDQWHALADTIAARYAGQTNPEPVVLIGHSYGADDVIRIARELQAKNVKVDLLVTIDPVTPPDVPKNVVKCVNIYRPNGLTDILPFFRGIPLKADSPEADNVINVNIRTDPRGLMDWDTDHFNIEKKPKVHAVVLDQVNEICPPREVWAALPRMKAQPTATPVVASAEMASETVSTGREHASAIHPTTQPQNLSQNGSEPAGMEGH